ncbi:hypothetical protein BDV27DRAFT_172223 [Aspergillus caelatus]|uniref:NAD(P)-binding protein n=1 Tax=Aspergillus caelatus TaxID=61420 RepID=A0A5N7A5Z0_9EURO|nr:uncharacterized protein BDV27DRAFT_172223 [Aspergillus caelatus]KAE8364606.1 hypothetical protein BDV27DRAFT_172223 [Aspergillus caelatus]
MAGVPGLLAGKVSIVTGASSGLGRAIALAFHKHGATVVCADRNASSKAPPQPTHELIQAGAGQSIFVPTDVTNASNVKELVQTVADKFGRVDVMVNNAGVAPEASNPCPVNNTTEEVFDMTWQVNVRGVFLGCKYAGAQMLRQPRIASHHSAGSIINVSSVLGLVGLSGTPAYAASKGAVLALTRTVAMDYAPHGIHCNAILPGFTRTPMIASMTEDSEFENILKECHPLQRIGDAEEIADAAVFLASRYSKGITGVNLSVDGGLHAQLRLK